MSPTISLTTTFDRLARNLWVELVTATFRWKYGGVEELPAYGSLTELQKFPFVVAVAPEGEFTFSEFVSNRAWSAEPFNAAVIFRKGERHEISVREITTFELRRS